MTLKSKDIKDALELLVKHYAKYNEDEKVYVSIKLNQKSLLQLDENFNQTLDKLLLTDGPKKDDIEKNYKKLSMVLHLDKKPVWIPEVVWLEEQLSDSPTDAICFKTLSARYEKIVNPAAPKNTKFEDVNTKEQLKEKLERMKAESKTYTGRYLFHSLSKMLEQHDKYFEVTGKIKPTGITALMRLLPLAFGGCGVVLMSSELLTIYATSYVFLKSGQALQRTESEELSSLGSVMGELSSMTATVTNILLIRSMELVFWTTRQTYLGGLQVGSAVLKPLLSSSKSSSSRHSGTSTNTNHSSASGSDRSETKANYNPEFWNSASNSNSNTSKTNSNSPSSSSNQTTPSTSVETETETRQDFYQNLKLASVNQTAGIQLNSPELKMVIAPLEAYLTLNKQQTLRSFRAGGDKSDAVKAFLMSVRAIDNLSYPIQIKLDRAKEELDKLKDDDSVYTKKTAVAVNKSEQVISLLTSVLNEDPEALQIVSYNK
ncbi:MAG: hypothetical protein WC627_12095 [Legionella sp.]|jgi:hypothetical protein